MRAAWATAWGSRTMPPTGAAKIGASGSAPAARPRAIWARHASIRLGWPGSRQAASSWGATAARLSLAVSPALIPPTSGSTRRARASLAQPAADGLADGDVAPGRPAPTGR